MTEEPTPYLNSSQQTLLRVLTALAQRSIHPTPLNLLEQSLEDSRDQIFRALQNLKAAGWVEQMPPVGGWRLTPRITQISEQVRLDIHELHKTYLGLKKGDEQ